MKDVDWSQSTIALGDICRVVRGSSPRPAGDPRFFDGDFLPWITVAELTRDETAFVKTTQSFLTKEGADHTRVFEPGTVLLSNSGATLGVPKITAIQAGANDGVAGFLDLSPEVFPLFLYYFLSSLTHHLRTQVASGVGQPNLNTELIAEIRLPLPPIPEQKAIAGVLSAWDRAIEQTTALIAAKQRLKQGLMQQLLTGQRRFKGFKGVWRECHLGDLFDDRREPGTDDLPLLSVTLDAGVVRRDSRDAPVRTSLEHEEHLLVRKGDIAYNMMRMWQGGSGVVKEDGVVSPAYVVCKPKDQIDTRFADHLFHIPRMIYLFWAYSYGLTDDRRRLYFDGFSRIPTRIPALAEQSRIADAVDCLDHEITQLKNRLKALGHQKRGLMQKLLTGEVRVSDKLLKQGAKS